MTDAEEGEERCEPALPHRDLGDAIPVHVRRGNDPAMPMAAHGLGGRCENRLSSRSDPDEGP